MPMAAGLGVILLFFGAFGGWAMFAPLNSAAIAPGVVTVESNRKTVQHLEGGIVQEIAVREGDRVAAGRVLIRLDETKPRSALELLRGRRLAALAQQARLIAERDGRDVIAFPAELRARSGEPETAKTVEGQRNILQARRKAVTGQSEILRQRMAQYAEEIAGLKGQIAAEDKQLELIGGEISDVAKLVKRGLARKPRLLALQRTAAEIEGNRSHNRSQIARAKLNITEAQLRISELETTMVNEAVQGLRETQGDLFDLEERIRAAEDVLRRTVIRAQVDGTIVGLRVHTPGGVIAPGEPLLDIIPSADRQVIEAQVDPADIDVVHPGLPAQVRLTAFNQRNLAPLDGRVTSISADRFTDQRTGRSYFVARVELADGVSENLGGGSLYPGMQAEVMIVTGQRTALDYMLRPLRRSLNRAFRED